MVCKVDKFKPMSKEEVKEYDRKQAKECLPIIKDMVERGYVTEEELQGFKNKHEL